MSLSPSSYFDVLNIANAGRGAITNQHVPAGTVILDSDPPAAHVIFRQYRKEVCAQCFRYDRGRTLPIRCGSLGKVFCTEICQDLWQRGQGELGVAAWQALQTFTQAKAKGVANDGSILPEGGKPSAETIGRHWDEVAELIELWPQPASRASTQVIKPRPNALQAHMNQVNPDILGLFLSGTLLTHQQPKAWQEVHTLAMDDEPYRSLEDLKAHCRSFAQLCAVVPVELLPSCSATLCRAIAEAGSHNAFGIRSGSEDGEEYMGWAIYPSASYFNHSCRPNILKRRVGSSWEFWTAEDLVPSSQCCISYLGGDEKHLTVAERRQRLKEAWGFECMCEGCQQDIVGA